MKILVKPSDLITRFVWDKYQDFCLEGKKNDEIKKIIEEDLEFEITEEDAFVSGLTNVIYTDEIGHKFKQFLREVLENKKFEQDKRYYINRQILIDSIKEFKNKIPKSWVCTNYEFGVKLAEFNDAKVYESFENGVNTLVSINVQDWPCVKYAQVKKIINKI